VHAERDICHPSVTRDEFFFKKIVRPPKRPEFRPSAHPEISSKNLIKSDNTKIGILKKIYIFRPTCYRLLAVVPHGALDVVDGKSKRRYDAIRLSEPAERATRSPD
jgi:hypothetical protein